MKTFLKKTGEVILGAIVIVGLLACILIGTYIECRKNFFFLTH